jgi:heme o synthase
MPGVWLVVATLVGGSLAAGSANTINSYLEQDLDEVMERTSRRPLVNHRVPPRNALRFGAILGVASFVWLVATVNVLSAVLALAAIFFYVVIYTIGLKRRSTQNIVIGGAAGCFPVLSGWTAVTNAVEMPAIVLFLIVFYWTPPHFWALAIRYREDYARAGVPMLPVVAGEAETARQILLYSVVMVAVTLVFGPIGGMGWIYLTAAVTLGAVFIAYAVNLRRTSSVQVAMQLFRYSITYLGLLFTAMAIDAVVLG